jgi:hypothetical protein
MFLNIIHFSHSPLCTFIFQSMFNNVLYTGTYSLKARIVESQLPAVTRQRPVNNNREMVFSARHLPMATHAKIWHIVPPLSNNCPATEERCFLCGPCRDVISMKSQSNCCGSVVVRWRCEKLVDEAGDSLVTQKKGNVRRLKLLPING